MPLDVPIADPLEPHSVRSGKVPVHEGDILAGKFRVESVLGVGGMGVVVAARHLDLDQRFAIKFMLPEAMRDPQMAERFLREARNAVRLASPHVARVLDVGTLENGAPYMVMEFLDGTDLRAIARPETLAPLHDVLIMMEQACEGVAEAHALGIVHRDIKPHNLFLTRKANGRICIKVLDFGISKTMEATLGLDSNSLTSATSIMGSPHYMAPEQMRSAHTVDARADVWALGVCLYQFLTGHVPFEAETMLELGAKVLHEQPIPITHYRPDLPRELSDIVRICLEKDPQKRFASAAQLCSALEQLLMAMSGSNQYPLMGLPPRGPAEASRASVPRGTPGSYGGKTDVAWGQTGAGERPVPWWLVAGGTFLGVLVVVSAILFGLVRSRPTLAAPPPPPADDLPVAMPPTAPTQAGVIETGIAPAPPATGIPGTTASSHVHDAKR
jgi:serine/threonine protein kinase